MERTTVTKPKSSLNDKWLPAAWLLPLLALAIGSSWSNSLTDDAYGLLRLAQNLAAGRGLFFDTAVSLPPSPLFLLLLTIADWLQLPLHDVALVLSALGWGMTAVILFTIGREWQRPLTGIFAAALLIFNPILITTLGLAAGWAVGLGWLAVRLGQKQQWQKQTAVLLLLLFSHIDLAVCLFAIYLWFRQPQGHKWRSGLLIPMFGLLSLGLVGWQFGFTAVFSIPEPAAWWASGQNLLRESQFYALLLPWAAFGLLPQEKRLRPLLLWLLAAVLSGSLLVGGITAVTLLFLAGLGVEWLLDRLQITNQIRLTCPQLAVALILATGLPQGIAQASSLWQRHQLQPQARWQSEQEAAAWLQQNSAPSATLAASPRLAYLADRTLLGDGRIPDPANLPAFLAPLLLDPPDYFITYHSLSWTYITQTDWFQERFQLAQQFSASGDTGGPLIIWEQSPSPFAGSDPTPITVRSDLGVDLVGYQVTPRRIQPGEAVHVQLNWQNNQTIIPYFRTVMRVVATPDYAAWAQRDLDTPRSLPVAWIEPATIFPERFVLTTTLDIPVGAYLVTASLYPPRDDAFVPLYQDVDTNALDRVTLGYVVVPWNGTVADTAVPLQASFGDQIKLLSCDCVTTAVPGQTINLRLYWEALRPPDNNYTVFVHLLDVDGQYITGHDAPPRSGTYDTAAWLPGDIIPDGHPLTLPPDLPAGDYSLRVGLYLPEDGTRLLAADAQGNLSPDQSILLPVLQVTPQNN